MELSKKYFIVLIIFIIGYFICACGKEDNNASESLVEDTKESAYIEKTKGLRKKRQSNGQKAMTFLWMNRKRKKLRMIA